jgi:hypothetical protein
VAVWANIAAGAMNRADERIAVTSFMETLLFSGGFVRFPSLAARST